MDDYGSNTRVMNILNPRLEWTGKELALSAAGKHQEVSREELGLAK